MRKVTNKDVLEVVNIAFTNMQEYTDFCLRSANYDDYKLFGCSTQEEMYKGKNEDAIMHFEDLQKMQIALQKFTQDKDANELQDAIMMQDTFVREYYVDTLRHLEDERLVRCIVCT